MTDIDKWMKALPRLPLTLHHLMEAAKLPTREEQEAYIIEHEQLMFAEIKAHADAVDLLSYFKELTLRHTGLRKDLWEAVDGAKKV